MFGQGRKPDKKAWMREAERTYEEVFGERDRIRNDGRLMTFSEIEEEAVREGNQLARWLLEGKVATQTERAGCHGETCPCPEVRATRQAAARRARISQSSRASRRRSLRPL